MRNILVKWRLFVAFVTFFGSHIALAQSLDRLTQVQKQLDAVFFQCPDRIWPNGDWASGSFVLDMRALALIPFEHGMLLRGRERFSGAGIGSRV